jgi:hypothetical protein
MTTLLIDERSTDVELAQAAQILKSGTGVVQLANICTLRALRKRLLCEVPDSLAGQHRCEEEHLVLIENARRALAASRLAPHLAGVDRVWRVVAQP